VAFAELMLASPDIRRSESRGDFNFCGKGVDRALRQEVVMARVINSYLKAERAEYLVSFICRESS
jgi:hypothetical protein